MNSNAFIAGIVLLTLSLNADAASEQLLQYDDGTPQWLCRADVYRGTWFHVQDFLDGSSSFLLSGVELWLYLPEGYSGTFTLSVHSGGSGGPDEVLYDTTLAAEQLIETLVQFPDSIEVCDNFWIVVSPFESYLEWPGILGDGTPNSVSHSFYSMDMVNWEPWTVQGPAANDYLVRAVGVTQEGQVLLQDTWGAVKRMLDGET